jgi:hypothetical protein
MPTSIFVGIELRGGFSASAEAETNIIHSAWTVPAKKEYPSLVALQRMIEETYPETGGVP